MQKELKKIKNNVVWFMEQIKKRYTGVIVGAFNYVTIAVTVTATATVMVMGIKDFGIMYVIIYGSFLNVVRLAIWGLMK